MDTEVAAIEKELVRLYKVIEDQEAATEAEIDATWKRIDALIERSGYLLIEEARARGLEYAEPLKPEETVLLPEWHPSGPVPRLSFSRWGLELCYLQRGDDAEVTVVFEGVRWFSLGPPTFDGLQKHPLWKRGLDQLMAARVINSKRVAEVETRGDVPPHGGGQEFTHYLFTFHDATFECIARSLRACLQTRR